MHTARQIVTDLGGVGFVADALGLSYTTVHSWARHNSIPEWRWPLVLDMAARKGLAISASDRPERKPSPTREAA